MDQQTNINSQRTPITSPPPIANPKKFFGNVFSYIKIHKTIFLIFSIVLILAASCIAAFCIYQRRIDKDLVSQTSTYGQNTPVSTPKPTPIPLIPDAGTKGTYKVSQAKHEGPTITEVTFDPLDVQKGQTLKIQVKIKTDVPAEKLAGELQTDNSQFKLSFNKVSADNQFETWQASLNLTDSVFYKYILTLSAINAQNISNITIAPRS